MTMTTRLAVLSLAAIALAACQTNRVPSCEEMQAAIEAASNEPIPEAIRLAYPNATYVGRGDAAAAFVRSGGRCREDGDRG